VLVRVAAIGQSSMRYDCVISMGDVRIATGTTTMVCVIQDATGLKAAPFPEDVISRFEVAPAP
jgi:acyl-CoA thioesterase FadM